MPEEISGLVRLPHYMKQRRAHRVSVAQLEERRREVAKRAGSSPAGDTQSVGTLKLMLECRVCAKQVEKFANGKKCRECYNAYMAKYMLKRYRERRAHAIDALGGKCARCGSQDQLELDHVDRSTKRGDLGKLFTQGEARYLNELAKCQLLCSACHIEKTRSEISVEHGGGLSGKRNCKCAPCRIKKNEYMREWKRTKRDPVL